MISLTDESFDEINIWFIITFLETSINYFDERVFKSFLDNKKMVSGQKGADKRATDKRART